MEIYVLDRDFTILGVIDGYSSVIWRPSYSNIGDFEIYISASDDIIELLREDRYVVRSADISIDDNNNVTYKNVMIIKAKITRTEAENGDFLTVTGKELKFILNQRIIWNQTIVNDTAENAIRRYVTENAIAPTDSNRIIPNLILDASCGLTDIIDKQVTAVQLDTTIIDICNTYNYGWEIYIFNNQLKFRLYNGIDRSYNQTDRPYVVFSDEFDNIDCTEHHVNKENFANTALVGGEGEGLDRTYVTCNNDNSGLDRYEIFVDANSIKSNKDKETEQLTDAEYKKLLQQHGTEKLAEYKVTEAFTGEIVNGFGFVYNRDFFLGDIVTVTNKYKVSKNVRVISAIESVDESGTKLVPQFNM